GLVLDEHVLHRLLAGADGLLGRLDLLTQLLLHRRHALAEGPQVVSVPIAPVELVEPGLLLLGHRRRLPGVDLVDRVLHRILVVDEPSVLLLEFFEPVLGEDPGTVRLLEEGPQGLLLLLEHVEDLVSLAEATDLVLELADAPVAAEMIDGAPYGVLDVDVAAPLAAQVRQALLDPGDLLPDLVDPGVETGELLLDVGEAAFVGEADDVAVVRLPVRSAVAVAGLPGRGDPGTFPVQRRRVGHAEMVSS